MLVVFPDLCPKDSSRSVDAGGERHRWDPDLEPQRGYTAAAVHVGLC